MRQRTTQAEWLAALAHTSPREFLREIEFELSVGGESLALSLPPDCADPLAMAGAVLEQLDRLDALAFAFLSDQPGWPYGDDADLWLVIVEEDSLRLCYSQKSCNDEQVVGFSRAGGEWCLTGHDPRFRGLAVDR